MRALLVFVSIVYPSVLLNDRMVSDVTLVTIFAFVCSAIVFMEYSIRSPSFLEFARSRPYNRIRFGIFLSIVFYIYLTINPHQQFGPPYDLAAMIDGWKNVFIGANFGPSQQMVVALGPFLVNDPSLLYEITSGALFVGLFTAVLGGAYLWASSWPLSRMGFNLSPNMPTFSPHAIDKTESRLAVTACAGLAFAIVFPILLPRVFLLAFDSISLPFGQGNLFTLWLVTIWVLVPATAVFRSLALLKVAYMINHLRKITLQVKDEDDLD